MDITVTAKMKILLDIAHNMPHKICNWHTRLMMTTQFGFSHFKTLILHIPTPIWLDVVPSRSPNGVMNLICHLRP